MPKISELNAITSVANTDLLMVVHDPSGSPSTNKVTLTNLASSITSALRIANTTAPGIVTVGEGLAISNGVISANSTSILPTSNTNEGYVLTWDEVTNTAIWQAFSGVFDYTNVNSANSYSVLEHDNIIFADPNAISQNIRIILPDASSTPPAVVGKSYTVKNINPGDNYKVTVTTHSGVQSNSNYLENPVTGGFIVSYDIGNKGESHTWIFDGTVYRHLAELSSSPVFYAATDSFHQVVIVNPSNSNAASGDWVAYNNQGNYVEGTGPFIDMGINSSTYTDTAFGNVWGPSDSYLYNQGGNLIIGPQSGNASIKFIAGNTNTSDIKLVVNSSAVFSNVSFVPTQNNVFDLGSANKQWKSLYVSNNTIYIGGTPVTVDAGGSLLVNGIAATGGYTGSAGNIGYTGSEGPAGSAGTTGYTGSVGSIGYAGSEGTAGNTGYTGSEGAAGTLGYSGSEGLLGYTGSEGVAGTNGYAGSQGDTGYTGSGGAAGTNGYTGSEGAGYTGSEGAAGTNGYTGSQGNLGYTGSEGAGFTGSQGDTGYAGSLGYTGSEGTGFTGSIGATGYTGSAGVISSPVSILKVDDGVQEAFQNISNANGVVTHDSSSGQIFYHTTPANNFTANVTNLNLDSGYATTLTLVISQGATGYYANALHISGNVQTIRWQGNTTPSVGNNRIDIVTFSILNSSNTYTVLGQLTGF